MREGLELNAEQLAGQIGKTRPELATLLLVVAMNLAALTYFVRIGSEALAKTSDALERLTLAIEAMHR